MLCSVWSFAVLSVRAGREGEYPHTFAGLFFLRAYSTVHRLSSLPAALHLMHGVSLNFIPHGGAIHIARAFQHSILPVLLLDSQHGLLELFFFFQPAGVCEQIHLIDPFIIYDPDGSDRDPAHSQRRAESPSRALVLMALGAQRK